MLQNPKFYPLLSLPFFNIEIYKFYPLLSLPFFNIEIYVLFYFFSNFQNEMATSFIAKNFG